MRKLFSTLLLSLSVLSSPVWSSTPGDIHQSGFVYCVNGVMNTFNPQMASSGLVVDTLAAQLYDRLLDVDPYTYRLMPELAESWEVLDDGATYRFHLRQKVPFQHTAWFTPTRTMNADDVVFSFERVFNRQHPWHNVNGGSYPYFDSLQFPDAVQSVKKSTKIRSRSVLTARMPPSSGISRPITHRFCQLSTRVNSPKWTVRSSLTVNRSAPGHLC